MFKRFNGNGGSKTARRGLSAADDLTNAVLATLSDHVAIVDGNGNIIAVNEAWKSFDCQCPIGLHRSGVGSNYLDVTRAAEQAGSGGFEGAILGLRAVLEGSRPHFSLTYLCQTPSGRQWFRMTAAPIGSPPDGAVISHTSVAHPMPDGEALDVAAIAPAETGEPLLRVLTEHLAKTIGARFAFLSEVVDQRAGRLRLIALWTGGEFEEGFEYDVDGTPCREVLRGTLCAYPADVQDSFPDDVWLKEIGAECYMAVPLFGSAGDVIGHLGVVHDHSLDNLSLAEHVLRAVEVRASAELERVRLLRTLEKSERTARALLNAPLESAVLIEPDGTITDLNEVAAVRLGVTVEEAVGKNIFDLFPPQLAATRRAALDEVMTSRKPLRMEDERAGMQFENSMYPILDLEGNVERVAGFATNITARKIAEEELQQSEEKFRLMAENMVEVYWLLDPKDYRMLYVSPAYEEVWGRTCESLYEDPKSWLADVHPEDLERVSATHAKLAETGKIEVEFRIIRSDGSIRWIWERGSAVKDERGQLHRVVGVCADITDRKQADEALAQSEHRIRQVTEHISEMVWLSDPEDGKLLYVSPGYEKIWGRSCQSLYNNLQSWLEAVHPDDLERVQAAVSDYEQLFDLEYRIIRPDGAVRWVWARSFAVHEEPDGRSRRAGIASDITERKQAEEAIREGAERNATLIDAIPDMIFTLNRRGVYVDFAPADGIEPYAPPDQFLGRTAFEVLPASLAQDLMRGVELALDTGRQQRLEYELELDGGRRQYEARILKSKEDEVLAIVRDVTAQKRLEREEELRRVRDELEGRVERDMLGKNPYGLTFREFTVLHLAANGAADKEIADQLGI
ncbi:MAG: PAS domain S-box protein, partial [Gemmatimonadota bacterium]